MSAAAIVASVALPEITCTRSADVVVVGSGVAGMVTALGAAEAGRQVVLVTKTVVGGGSSRWAQGGIAAAVGPGDSPRAHAQDTRAAGGGLCDQGVVELLTEAGPPAVDRLQAWGVRFDREGDRLALGREGGHRRARVIHAGGDATGAELVRVLGDRLASSKVEVSEHVAAVDLIRGSDGRAGGVVCAEIDGAGRFTRVLRLTAGTVVLATGGLGQAFAATTNPAEATGDGLALAARAGAYLRHLEFVQFHPTVLCLPDAPAGQRPLLTEALRGAGAVIVDRGGERVLNGAHPLGDLAPRDVVAAAMARNLAESGEEHLWLDLRPVEEVGRRFPTVVAACSAGGLDPAQAPVPVRPAAHYACGGIAADLDGATSLPGLMAVGEVAATGVHGANRLASNSLLEAVVAGARVAAVLGAGEHRRRTVVGLHPLGARPANAQGIAGAVSPTERGPMAAATERFAGVLRDGDGLGGLLAHLSGVAVTSAVASELSALEATNLHAVSTLVAAAALAREESRGCHQRSDRPGSAAVLAVPADVTVDADGTVGVLAAGAARGMA